MLAVCTCMSHCHMQNECAGVTHAGEKERERERERSERERESYREAEKKGGMCGGRKRGLAIERKRDI